MSTDDDLLLRLASFFDPRDEPNKLYEIVPPYAARESSRSAGSRGHALYSQLAADLRLIFRPNANRVRVFITTPRNTDNTYVHRMAELNCGAKVNVRALYGKLALRSGGAGYGKLN
ncbi:hypothetical protein EVAR_87938_1 [Eumeta japonica]|uniref:Uncharacterized protein n=1 Tax=Eumeta variegata TaxID=151549 RepID=A0A4C2A9F1_EUMVA|nr:hypothetical protein EVAR_87938_1 [Eumeta japonica]